MKASKETLDKAIIAYEYIIANYPKEIVQRWFDAIKEDNRIKNIRTRLSWEVMYLSYKLQGLSLYGDLIKDEYNKGLDDTHLNTVFEKAFKQVFLDFDI